MTYKDARGGGEDPTAEILLRPRAGAQSTYPRYWSKLPRQEFADRRPRSGWTTKIEVMRQRIERAYAAGRTQEPYVQLVEETRDSYRVVAEWTPGQGWADPWQAAGFAAR